MDLKSVQNVVIETSKWRQSDIELLFGDEKVYFTTETNMPRLLKELKVFGSTSEAIRAGRKGEVLEGFTDRFKASKKRFLWIWNPTE